MKFCYNQALYMSKCLDEINYFIRDDTRDRRSPKFSLWSWEKKSIVLFGVDVGRDRTKFIFSISFKNPKYINYENPCIYNVT